jgi:hypothetical protein
MLETWPAAGRAYLREPTETETRRALATNGATDLRRDRLRVITLQEQFWRAL